jgi:hypothetical protein
MLARVYIHVLKQTTLAITFKKITCTKKTSFKHVTATSDAVTKIPLSRRQLFDCHICFATLNNFTCSAGIDAWDCQVPQAYSKKFVQGSTPKSMALSMLSG